MRFILGFLISMSVLAGGTFQQSAFAQVTPEGHFFLKYYDILNKQSERSTGEIQSANADQVSVPKWFADYSKKHELGKISPVFDLKKVDSKQYAEMISILVDTKYNSHYGGAIGIALQVAAADMKKGFAVLKETIDTFPSEFKFEKLQDYRKEKEKWQTLLKELPETEKSTITLKDQEFKLVLRSNGRLHAVAVLNSDNKVVFTDGPRWLSNKNNPKTRGVSTSMTTTWTEPEYRGFGIYQHVLLFYLKKFEAKNLNLYTENAETLEFIYFMKNSIYDEAKRAKLLKVPGLTAYFEAVGVPVDNFKDGKIMALQKGEEVLNYLSLQGRTRLNLGLSFEVDRKNPASINSRPLEKEVVDKTKDAMKVFESEISKAMLTKDKSLVESALPGSYLTKFNSCKGALKKAG